MGKATFRIDAPKPAVMASVSRALDEIRGVSIKGQGWDAFAHFSGGQWLRDELTVTWSTTWHPKSGESFTPIYRTSPHAVKLAVLALTDRRTRLDCDWADMFGAEVGQLLELLALDFPEMQDQLPARQVEAQTDDQDAPVPHRKDVADRVKQAHELLKTDNSQSAVFRYLVRIEKTTYRKYCRGVTGEDPIV